MRGPRCGGGLDGKGEGMDVDAKLAREGLIERTHPRRGKKMDRRGPLTLHPRSGIFVPNADCPVRS